LSTPTGGASSKNLTKSKLNVELACAEWHPLNALVAINSRIVGDRDV